MQTFPEIDFEGIGATPQIRAAIARHLAELEERCGRITGCRVAVKAPSARHRSGGLYEVHIRLLLPEGREVNVSRTPTADARHADVSFAIDDAFKHARRQLQDEVRRTQGQIKQHQEPQIGTIVRLDPSCEFGFLESGEGQEIYFHRNSVLDDGFARLRVGSRVTYAEEMGDKGAQASAVRLVGKRDLKT